MALQRFDRIAETTTTTGTGTYSLAGAVSGFQTFVSRVTSGNTVEYCCVDGADFEIGIGTFTDASPDTIARTTILASSNSDAAVNWGAGTRTIFLTPLASRFAPGLVNQIAYYTAVGVLGGDSDFTFDGTDAVLRGKMDIGAPGAGTGLDVGEAGSYSANAAGATIVKAYFYDASAASGSRFTQLTITAQNTLLGDAGDRIYIGSPHKHWACRFTVGVAKTTEALSAFYWNGSALTACTYMGTLKNSVTTLGTAILQQTSEQEYVTVDKAINADWAAADNQLDAIPNDGTSLFWIAYQVPGGGLATSPRVDDIKVRGTDVDFATGISQLIHWGRARVEIHEKVATFSERSAAQPKLSDESWTSDITTPLFKLRNSFTDGVDFIFKLPKGIDTSSKMAVTLDWFTDNSGEVNWSLHYKISKQGTVIGSGESSTASVNTSITPSAANALQEDDNLLTSSQLIDISSLGPDNLIALTLERDGSGDTNSGSVFPINVTIHYVLWTAGEHV